MLPESGAAGEVGRDEQRSSSQGLDPQVLLGCAWLDLFDGCSARCLSAPSRRISSLPSSTSFSWTCPARREGCRIPARLSLTFLQLDHLHLLHPALADHHPCGPVCEQARCAPTAANSLQPQSLVVLLHPPPHLTLFASQLTLSMIALCVGYKHQIFIGLFAVATRVLTECVCRQ
eukprot:13542-Hanusia_phi.AAC.2